MLTKIFAIIESIKIVNQWWQLIHSSYIKYRISKLSGELDERQDARNMALDAIKKAQEERDEDKILRYSYYLATGRMPEPGVSETSGERLSDL